MRVSFVKLDGRVTAAPTRSSALMVRRFFPKSPESNPISTDSGPRRKIVTPDDSTTQAVAAAVAAVDTSATPCRLDGPGAVGSIK